MEKDTSPKAHRQRAGRCPRSRPCVDRGSGPWDCARSDTVTRDGGGRRPLGLPAQTHAALPSLAPAPPLPRHCRLTPGHRRQDARRRDAATPRESRLPPPSPRGATANSFRRTALGPSTMSRNYQRDGHVRVNGQLGLATRGQVRRKSQLPAPASEEPLPWHGRAVNAGLRAGQAADLRPGLQTRENGSDGKARGHLRGRTRAPGPPEPLPVTFRRSWDISGRMRFTPYRTTSAAETDLPAARPGSCPRNTSSGGTGTARLRGGTDEPARLGLPHPRRVSTGWPLSAVTRAGRDRGCQLGLGRPPHFPSQGPRVLDTGDTPCCTLRVYSAEN